MGLEAMLGVITGLVFTFGMFTFIELLFIIFILEQIRDALKK